LTVVGEGVEIAAQLEGLRGLGCDEAQGYLFSRPVEADDLAALLRLQDYGPARRSVRSA
jgi:EAL domain-containing protein (putative c-di-GMP-specific phosphodiesterase class I)